MRATCTVPCSILLHFIAIITFDVGHKISTSSLCSIMQACGTVSCYLRSHFKWKKVSWPFPWQKRGRRSTLESYDPLVHGDIHYITKFCILLTVYLITIFVNNQFDAQFFFLYLFIQILYMFRAAKCSSSGETVVTIRPLVYVTVWYAGLDGTCIPHDHIIDWHIPEVVLIQLTLLMMSNWLLETCREFE